MATEVICGMKTEKLDAVKAEEEYEKIPVRAKGQWTTLFEEMKKDKQPRRVTGITAGQIAAIQRKAKELKFRVKRIEKGTGVLILPPEKKV
jgi:hypothetical protein